MKSLIKPEERTIIYLDFAQDVDKLVSSLAMRSVKAHACYGKQSVSTKKQVQNDWKQEGGVMVATKAFGLGINQPDVRHVIK